MRVVCNQWQIDPMKVDLMKVDFMTVDLLKESHIVCAPAIYFDYDSGRYWFILFTTLTLLIYFDYDSDATDLFCL